MPESVPPPPEPPPFERDPHNQIDPRTVTGSYRIIVKRQYGRRKGDKPLWWVIAYHTYKALAGVLPILAYLATALLFRRCGVQLPMGLGHP